MGVRGPRDIFDLSRFNLDVGVECKACGRFAAFVPLHVFTWFSAHRYSTVLPIVKHPFRCRCGSRDMTVSHVPSHQRPVGMKSYTTLRPVYVLPRRRR